MEGKYLYRHNLQACKPDFPKTVPPSLSVIQSPLSERSEEWRKALQGHPDKLFYQHIFVGVEKGFRIGYNYTWQCKASGCNLASALENPEVVQEYIQKEMGLGRIVGPMEKASAINLQVSPFGVIPKQHTPGQWRLIVDLFHPCRGVQCKRWH